MNNFKNMLHDFFTDEEGQGTVEWILITALIVVALMILIYAFRQPIMDLVGEAQDETESFSIQ